MLNISLGSAKRRLRRAVCAAVFLGSITCAFCVLPSGTLAQSLTFGGNAQHTSSYAPPAQNLNTIKWTTNIDFNNTGALVHYGSPLVTAGNTVLVPVKTATDGFQVEADSMGRPARKNTR